MPNFPQNLEKMSDVELMNGINQHSPDYGSLESDELTCRSLNKLQNTIEVFNKESSKQNEKMVKMTDTITRLTFTLFVIAVVQLLVALMQTLYMAQEMNSKILGYSIFFTLICGIVYVIKKSEEISKEVFPKRKKGSRV